MDSNSNYTSGNDNYQYGNSPYGNYQYGNGQYGNGQYGNGQYAVNSQYNNYNNFEDPSKDEESNFNVLEWVFKILHYWYLFVIAIIIALGIAYLQNRKWLPSYYTQGTIIIKETTGYGGANSVLMQGFGVDAGYKNVQNQLIMLRSYDLACRVVDSLPYLRTEYISQGRFKTRNLYRESPIYIEPEVVPETTVGLLFEVTFNRNGTLTIESTDEERPFKTTAHYGELIENKYFTATILPTERMTNSGHIFFRFRSRDGLASEIMSRLKLNFVTDGSSVLALGLVSETPVRDCEIIDELAKIFLLQNLEQKNEVAENSIRFITEQLEALQESLEVSEGAMTDFRQQNKFVDVGSYAGQLMSSSASYKQELLSMKLRETYFDYLTNYLATNMESGAVIAPATLGVNDPSLVSLTQQLNDLRIQRGELSEKNVYYAKYTKDIENVKAMINEVISSMRASLEMEKQDLIERSHRLRRTFRNSQQRSCRWWPLNVITALMTTTTPSSSRSEPRLKFKRQVTLRITRFWIRRVRSVLSIPRRSKRIPLRLWHLVSLFLWYW